MIRKTVAPSDRCELHEAVIVIGAGESEDFQRLARSPIGDECQRCTVCRLAREYVERRLAEQAGYRFPSEQDGDAAWRELRSAVDQVRTSVHKTS